MIKCENKFRYYACAMGEHRSQHLSREDKGSLVVEHGYVGMSQWLTMISPDRRGQELHRIYPDSMIILVYDGIVDYVINDFRKAYNHVRRELHYSGLPYTSMSFFMLSDMIRSNEQHFIVPSRSF